MNEFIIGMEKILTEENDLFKKLYGLEEKKIDAITNQKGKLLEKISMDQEELISKVALLEPQIENLIENYNNIENLKDKDRRISLREIADSMDESCSGNMLSLGMKLKDIMDKLQDLRDNNEKLINDNMEFYNIFLSSLKSITSIEAGYDNHGKEDEKVTDSILFNQKA